MSQLNWKGKPYRPVGGTGYIKVYKPDVNELLKPLSQKKGLGSAFLTGNAINPVNEPSTTSIPVTPSPTPTLTSTPTPSITPSTTPVLDCYWNTNDDNWENDSTLWNDCVNVPTPTPSPTQTMTPTNTSTSTPTPSITPSSSPAPSGTTEAYTFLNAVLVSGGTGVTSTVSAATETLFTSIVSNGLWDKISIFYPMIGGNSGGMSIQGKNPGTNNLQFNGGWTFSSSGATGNGTNAYAQTFYNDNQTLLDDMHLGIYSFVANSNTAVDAGVFSVTANSRTGIYINEATTTGIAIHRSNSGYGNWTSTANTGAGMYVMVRTGSTDEDLYVNGTRRIDGSTSSNARCDLQYVFGARNADGGPEGYSNKGYNFFCIGLGLTSGETQTLSTIVNTFNTTLSRNTY